MELAKAILQVTQTTDREIRIETRGKLTYVVLTQWKNTVIPDKKFSITRAMDPRHFSHLTVGLDAFFANEVLTANRMLDESLPKLKK